MAKITAICISEKRGIQKKFVNSAKLIENHGIEGDAHAGNWHRQVSFLDQEIIDKFNEKGAGVAPGAFGENIIVSGLDVLHLPIGAYLHIGSSLLEITQHGKECHDHCQIYYKMGECIMPKSGVFTKVIKGGDIKVGDEVKIIERKDKPFTAAVITLSDKGFKGEREDLSGPAIINRLKEDGYEVVEYILIPDNEEFLKKSLLRLSDQREVDLILTTGGTGCTPKDITPEVTKSVFDKEIPGISEAIRAESLKFTSHAMLSRGVSGIRNKSIIINLPGSPKACLESMDVFLKPIVHAIKLVHGLDGECARKDN